ncbi:MAG: HAD-IIIA family hydrolase [Candidatus Fermentibacteraceae bacterium]|nr:HAD-IIIA family hydrolase [Candidatus Fermentibacteraceae bacterium]MBN2607666.1 HAD-IIIA family hydrolase [Candidatus Fermentibacteraceae bacterium]
MRVPVFLDRDGVINRDRDDYVKSLEEWKPFPGAVASIVRLCSAGHPVVVITNQSAIGRNYCTEACVRDIHSHLTELVRDAGGALSGIYYCPHRPDEGCACRKPETGMVDAARSDLDLPAGGYIVGDAESDMELGRRAGLKTILVLTGRGSDQLGIMESGGLPAPWRVAGDISEAVEIIISDSG